MKKVFLLAVTLLVTGFTFAVEQFTSAEKAQITQLATQTEKTCISGLEKQVDLTQGPFAITREYVNNYCGCINRGIHTKVDVKMIRQGTEADGRKLLQSVAQECAIKEFKSDFPKQCRKLYEMIPRDPSVKYGEQDFVNFCGCLGKSVENLNASQLNETIRQTLQEYQSYKLDQNFEPKLPLSLVNASKSCIGKK